MFTRLMYFDAGVKYGFYDVLSKHFSKIYQGMF